MAVEISRIEGKYIDRALLFVLDVYSIGFVVVGRIETSLKFKRRITANRKHFLIGDYPS